MKSCFALPLLLFAVSVNAQTAFTVNGELVPETKIKALARQLQISNSSLAKEDSFAQARAILIRQAVISQEAKKQQLDRSLPIQLQVENRRTELLINELLKQKGILAQPKEAELQKVYEDLKKSYDPNELKVRQILVSNEEAAAGLLARIRKGEDMAELAKKYSIDKETAASGGEFPYLKVSSIVVPGYAQAALTLEPGQLMAVPFKSEQGFHVVRLEGKKVVPIPQFADIKDQISGALLQKKTLDYVNGLLSSAKVEEYVPKVEAPKPKKAERNNRRRADG